MPFVTAAGHRLHYEWLGPRPDEAPTIVMLHEGLGSVEMWRDFPRQVQEATGCGVLVYSRWGYGQSEPFSDFPHKIDYMTTEAQQDLPALLQQLAVEHPIFLGHSDGASIALIYGGSALSPAPLGIICMAPHVFVEQICTDSIAEARVAYEKHGLRAPLSKYHQDVDSAFYGWNTVWLLPQFIRDWNIEGFVDKIACPVTVIQGIDDEYGTVKQLDSIRAHSGGKAAIIVLDDCKHSPHRDQPAATMAAIVDHVAPLRERFFAAKV